MNRQATITIAVLTLGALGAFSFFFTTIRDAAEQASLGLTRSAAAPSPTPQFLDTDKDGLPDREEALWGTDYQNPDTDGDGFKDGEETVSGRDPLIPGPDDLLPYQGQGNVTERTTNLVLGALASGATTKSGDLTEEAAGAIVDDIILQAQLNIPAIETHRYQVVADTPEIIAAYSKAMQHPLQSIIDAHYITFESFLTALEAYQRNPDSITKFIASDLAALDALIGKLDALIVPRAYASKHDALLTSLKRMRQHYATAPILVSDPFQYISVTGGLWRLLFVDTPESIGAFRDIFSPRRP
ncbi:MAG: hypothetical protein QY311_02135 [Candidatus Paceibacterota bacterium]|nr:MAG: hypothetical protein QY311_02135 [Candidatus Paceibacterota bacterium]